MTNTAWEAARARYDNPGKNKGRMVPVRIAARLPRGARYLELSGGGLSAEAVRAVRPDLEMISADTDRELWPDLLEHARRFDYHALCGSFDKAEGLFDLIYLDLTGNTGKNSDSVSLRLVHKAVKMLTPDGWLVVTITPDHELDSAVSLNRPVTVVSLLAAESGLRAVGAMRYPNGDGKRVTLCVLRGRVKSFRNRWRYVLDVYKLDADIKRRGFWTCGDMDHGGYGFMFGDKNARYRADPKNHEIIKAGTRRQNERRKVRMTLDPVYAESQREWRRAYRQRPEVKAKARAGFLEWQRSEAGKAWRRQWLARKKLAAVSGTATEAISSEEAA